MILCDVLPALPLADAFYAFNESSLPGKLIVLLLGFSSIGAWTVMVTKFLELNRAKLAAEYFMNEFRKQTGPLSLFLQRRRYPETPLNAVYETACKGFGVELKSQGIDPNDLFQGGTGEIDGLTLTRQQLEIIRGATEASVADQCLSMEDNMGWLATAVSACPFLGLLGTVWGVMDAFGGMAAAGSATLSAVAPGIAGALLTTVIGLLVALPSAVGYNMLTNRIRQLAVQTDNFAQELIFAIQRDYVE
ncbi:MotA/TolQ/ExbB proton channel family protein [Verrucomicrobiota bacterium]